MTIVIEKQGTKLRGYVSYWLYMFTPLPEGWQMVGIRPRRTNG